MSVRPVAPPYGELRLVEHVPSAFAALVAGELAGSGSSPTSPWQLALSGGPTARACYECLAQRDDIDWPSLELFLGDERCVPPDDPDANQRLIREVLGARVETATFHPMDCADPAAYDALLAERVPLDFVHLGLGPDGHTASLFPGSPALESPPERLAVTNHDPSGTNPHERLTMTFRCIDLTRLAVFTVAGEAKAEALGRVLAGEDLPATRVRAQRVLWLADRAALGDAAERLA